MNTRMPPAITGVRSVVQRKTLTCLFALLFLFGCGCAQSRGAGCDQSLLTIKAQALQSAFLDADHDPVKMYSLVRRASYQQLTTVAYDVLKQMCREQPKNAVVLAAYCFAFRVAEGEYTNPLQKNPASRSLTGADFHEYDRLLQRAYQLDPKLWLTYAVEGHTLMDSLHEDRKALRLLKTAVRLAPDVSYPHILLAEAYGVYGTPYHSFQASVKESEIARRLDPVSARNASNLFDIYDIRMPDREKAADAKRYLLSTVPPGFKFSQSFQERLARY